MAAIPLAEQVRRNKAATARLFLILFLILFAMVFAIGYALGYPPIITAPAALIFGLIYLAMASSFSVQTVLKAARARAPDMEVPEERRLVEVVEEMAIAARIPMPKVYVQESNDINAFATGRKPEEGVICATTGALRDLTREELQGVIGHEVGHIRNYDIRITTYAIALIGVIAMIGEIVWRALFFGGGRKKDVHPAMILVAIALAILAPLLSRMVYLAISRSREYLADTTGAELTRNPEALASALEKILHDKPEPHHGDRTVASLYFANPFKRKHANSLWSSHPPLEERISRLRGRPYEGPPPQ